MENDNLQNLMRELERTREARTKKMAELENLLGEKDCEFEQQLKKSEIDAYEKRIDRLEAQIAELQK